MKLEPLNEYARFAFALGRADGTAGLIAKILAQRFGPLPYEVKLRLSEALMWKLELIADRLLTAKTFLRKRQGYALRQGAKEALSFEHAFASA